MASRSRGVAPIVVLIMALCVAGYAWHRWGARVTTILTGVVSARPAAIDAFGGVQDAVLEDVRVRWFDERGVLVVLWRPTAKLSRNALDQRMDDAWAALAPKIGERFDSVILAVRAGGNTDLLSEPRAADAGRPPDAHRVYGAPLDDADVATLVRGDD
jgi:hypothetical protein